MCVSAKIEQVQSLKSSLWYLFLTLSFSSSLSISLSPSPSPSSQHLLQSRLVEANPEASPQQLQDEVRMVTSGADYITLDMLRLRLLAPVRPSFPIARCY